MQFIKTVSTFSIISCAIFSSQFAHANEEWNNQEWADSAWYIGAGLGKSRANIDDERIIRGLTGRGATSVMFAADERDLGYKIFAGKQLNKYFALEAGYFDLGKFGFKADTTPPGEFNGDVRFRGLNADLLAQLPLSERFSLLGRIGINYAKANAHFSGNRMFSLTDANPSQRKLNPKIGLGLEYKFTEALAVRGEMERYRVNDAVHNRGDVDLYSVSLVYKLGKPAPTERVVAAPEPKAAVIAVAPPERVVETPAPAKPVPVSEKVTFAAEALFDFDKSVVKPEGRLALDELLRKLKGMNTEVMVAVGHTDSIGTDVYNQKLSLRRAEAVKTYLISVGIEASRIYTEGKGETQPVADNNTAEGRSKNRRVTIEVVGLRTVGN